MNINEQRIREFAYQIWESEGKPHGHTQRHWDMASKLAQVHATSAAAPELQQSASTETAPSVEPIEPISPTQPAQPVTPSDPIQPTDPVTPSQPVQPGAPVAQATQTAEPTIKPKKVRAKSVPADTKPILFKVSENAPDATASTSIAEPPSITKPKQPTRNKKSKTYENEPM